MKHFKLSLIILFGAALSVQAQPVMVKNIYPGDIGSVIYPIEQYAVVGNTFYFEADDDTHGSELWKSNGTSAGTVLVRDINPDNSVSGVDKFLIEFQGHLYFMAKDYGSFGIELWRTVNGPEGATMITDACPGPCPNTALISNARIAVLNDKLYMCYYSVDNGNELWESDGTSAGTKLVKDIYTGNPDSRPEYLTPFNGNLYFMAASGPFGRELWVSNGTESGTQMLKDINPGPNESTGSAMLVGDNALYFWASNGVSGKELWKTDGTVAGTVMVKDINPGPGNGATSIPFSQYLWYGDRLLFVANNGVNGDELWITDGTEAGTMMVQDITPGAGSSEIRLYGVVNGVALFRCKDDAHGRELWVTDGSPAGTTLLKDILLGADGGLQSTFFPTVFQNYLFFGADDGVNGYELWISDGTANGTKLQTDIRPGALGSFPGGFSLIGNTMFFFAQNNSAGRELWKYDLTPLSATTPEPLSVAVFPTVSADGRFAIQPADTGEGLRVEAFDLPGRLLTVRTLLPGTRELDLSVLRPGAYILHLTGMDTGRSTAVRVFVNR